MARPQAVRTERTQVLRISRLLLSRQAPAGGAIRNCHSDTITVPRKHRRTIGPGVWGVAASHRRPRPRWGPSAQAPREPRPSPPGSPPPAPRPRRGLPLRASACKPPAIPFGQVW